MRINKQMRWGLVLAATLGMTACKNNDVDPNAGVVASKGTADFSRYVAVGNSLTAGFADNGLYRSGQLNSYPNILAGQFRTVSGGDFVQPLFSVDSANGSGYLKLIAVPTLATLATSIVPVAPGAARGGLTAGGSPLLRKFTGVNQNLGVPGIRMADIQTPGYGSVAGNQYFERLLGNPLKTYLSYVTDNVASATFFSCWMGNNDALLYAASGGVTPITDATTFQTNYNALITVLTANSRKGVVIGVPNVTTAPLFTTVTLPLLLATVNAGVQKANPGAPVIPALVIQGKNGIRATQAGDLLLLSAYSAGAYNTIGSTAVGTKNGPYGLSATNPLPTQLVLDADEVTAVNTAIGGFNTTMKAQADAKGLAYVDPNAVLDQAAKGFTQNGVTYSSAFVSGGVFGLDGVHLTPAGYALIANEIIRNINAKYSATIPSVDASRYNRVVVQPN